MSRTVAYLTSYYARAGDTFIRREVEELRRRGWTVHTFSIRRADEGEQVSAEIAAEQRRTDYVLEHGALRLLGAFARSVLRSPFRMVKAVRQAGAVRPPGLRSWLWHWAYLVEASYVAEKLAERRVGLLHGHIAMASGTVALLASTLSGIPFSLTVHGSELLAAEHWALAQKISASSLTVCISSYGRAQCMLFTPPAQWPKLEIVHCGLDGPFLEAPAAPLPDNRRLISVGRLSPEKGQLLLVEAAALLRDQGIDAEIVLVGDGPSRAAIEGRARELGVERMVRLVGWQGSAEVIRAIAGSRALVLPSFNEGLPVVLMEALALGRPVVATWVGGIPELVEPGESGWLVPAGSPEELARAMREVLLAPRDRLARMGRAGRRRVLARHDVRAEVGRLAGFFDRVMRSPASASRFEDPTKESST